MERRGDKGDSPVSVRIPSQGASRVTRGTRNPVRRRQDHLPRLNTTRRPIVDQYREGKGKSTPGRGVKQNLKPSAYKRRERLRAVTACLLHNEPTSCSSPARLSASSAEPQRKRVPQGD